jgi:ADP-heptose:LPS heptosyltransferase/GT2 family glycosyltransferase
MCADMADHGIPPALPPRIPFRARRASVAADGAADGTAGGAARDGLHFFESASAPGTDRDVLMGYQLFLGRDPENSFVMGEAKASPLRGFIAGLMQSGEFQTAVLQALARRQPMPHERGGVGPAPEQLAWLRRIIALPERLAPDEAALDWRGFWTALIALPGFPRGAETQAAIADAPAPVAADEGFILITVDQPRPGDKLHPGAPLNGAGWAIAPEDIAEVVVTLDDLVLTHARYGLPRPDVARNFPHYRHVDHCGFAFSAQVPADAVITASSQLGIVVKTVGGQTGRRGVRVSPPAPPAAQVTWPIRLFVEDVRVGGAGDLRLRGWALSRAGIASIAVFLGEAKLGEADHGLARPDIAEIYTDYPDAAQSGFVFGASLLGQLPGPAALRVQLTDKDGQQRQVLVPVMVPGALAAGAPAADAALAAAEAAQAAQAAEAETAQAGRKGARRATPAAEAEPVRFHCDGATVYPDGRVSLTGWALAPGGVRDIAAMRGRRKLAVATLGGIRADVGRSFPHLPEAGRAGFRCSFTPDPAPQPGDKLTLRLRTQGGETLTLEAALVAGQAAPDSVAFQDSAAPAAPAFATRLEIDKPVLAGDAALVPVRGALTLAGWTVAPSGIASVAVLCDGAKLGQAYVGMRREDIGRAFPDCLDSLRAGFAMVLPPGAVADGTHQFTVVATSRDGDIQSRSFSVTVEPADEVRPGSTPRLSMPRAEQGFMQALLASRGCQPEFTVALLPAPDGGEAALRETLASLARQAYGGFRVVTGIAEAEALAAGLPGLAGRVAAAADGAPCPDGAVAPCPDGAVAPCPDGAAAPCPDGAAAPYPDGAAAPGRPRLFMALQAGDTLGCDALLELAAAFAMDREDGFIYADEWRFDPVHDRHAPFHKPDWSPELLLNMDYVGRPWCASAAVMRAAGLGVADLLGQPSYASVLRLTEAAPRVRHINKVLGATACVTSAQEAAPPLAARAARRGEAAEAVAADVAGIWRLRRRPDYRGVVSIIIPTAGRRGLVRSAIESIRRTTPRGQVEIVVLDNVPESDRATRTWLRRNADRVIAMPGPFNWSRFNNQAAAQARGDMLLFLNDDIEAHEPGWLEALLEHAVRPEVAVTGARLLYPDGKVQHGGQYLADSHARHAFRFAAGEDAGPFGLALVAREMASVTGACQLVRREVFERLGGFDEAHDVVNNDLDFCLRAQALGLSVIYTPHAELMHHELASRAAIEDSYDAARFAGDWRATLLRGDPFHSRRLHTDADHCAPDPEPVLTIHAGPAGPALDQVRRILAVKLDHIGDFLTAVPAIRALAARFPGARITALVAPASAVLARQTPGIDEVIEFTFFHARSADGQRGVTEPEYAALGARLAQGAFDMAIDLRMQPETRPVLRHSGAPFLVGYDREGAHPWLDVSLEWEGDARLVAKHAHISERLLALVDAAAAACRPVAQGAVPAARDPVTVPALARLPRDFLARRLVCVHPGVGNPVRQWPAASYAALIDLLAAEEDMHAILIGGADEQAVAREVLAAVSAQDRVVSLVGAVKLAELPAVLEACALFVGNNSGPKHIAASLGVPVLGIHSAVVDATEWAPLGPAAMALQRRVICGPCYLEFASDCPRGLACLTGIRPRDALAACRRLLALRPAAARAPAEAASRGKIRRRH